MKKTEIIQFKNVFLGKNIILQPGVVLGMPPFGKKDGELETKIGDNAVIRSNTIIYSGTIIGDNFQSGHNVVIRENNKIGNDFCIWSNTVLSPHNTIGNNVKIHCGCFIESSIIEDGVFLGPHVVTSDDLHPVCPRWKDCVGGAIIRKNVSIGAGVLICPGIEIGENSLIGAGSVVSKNINKNKVVVGNPAREIKSINELKCKKGFYEFPYEWRKNES